MWRKGFNVPASVRIEVGKGPGVFVFHGNGEGGKLRQDMATTRIYDENEVGSTKAAGQVVQYAN
ncbi:hypothetical protein BCON_0122g00200 [Botryotinia convoluta]|uniref:Uncharacterized protein n=1 Tax=Botryotinia convoluta TaxID=54673 RepID=A0A4Z1I990_9HELO|nr:hypothetical protein BCON_0122g00200 [Botryotinia convoluta]